MRFFCPKNLERVLWAEHFFWKFFLYQEVSTVPRGAACRSRMRLQLGFVKICAYAAKKSPVLVEKCRYYIKFGIISSICICSLPHAATAAARFRSRTSRYGPIRHRKDMRFFFAVWWLWSKKILRPFFFFFCFFPIYRKNVLNFLDFLGKKFARSQTLSASYEELKKRCPGGGGLWCKIINTKTRN